jgi:hypothetical protein
MMQEKHQKELTSRKEVLVLRNGWRGFWSGAEFQCVKRGGEPRNQNSKRGREQVM